MENHHLRCGVAVLCKPLDNIIPPQENQEATNSADPAAATTMTAAATTMTAAATTMTAAATTMTAAATTMTAARQDEQLTLLGEFVTIIHQTTTRNVRCNHVVQQTLAQCMNDLCDTDQQQLQRMTHTLETIITEQQRRNEQLQARQQAS